MATLTCPKAPKLGGGNVATLTDYAGNQSRKQDFCLGRDSVSRICDDTRTPARFGRQVLRDRRDRAALCRRFARDDIGERLLPGPGGGRLAVLGGAVLEEVGVL